MNGAQRTFQAPFATLRERQRRERWQLRGQNKDVPEDGRRVDNVGGDGDSDRDSNSKLKARVWELKDENGFDRNSILGVGTCPGTISYGTPPSAFEV